MRRFLTVVLCFLPVALCATDGLLLQRMTERMQAGATVCFKFEVTGEGTGFSGDAVVCGSCYRARMGQTEVLCDSVVRYTVDSGSKEVYIEYASASDYFWAAPERYLPDVTALKVTEREITGIYKDSRFRIYSILWLEKMPEEAFRFDTGSLPADWVATDLRL